MGEAWSLVPHTAFAGAVVLDSLTLPALMDFYIHPLYILVSKILSST
jgi:hypothetical protein